jgi:hypothetical protein
MAPFPHWFTVTLSVVAISVACYFGFTRSTAPNQQLAQAVIGHDIQNSGPGTGQLIENSGGGTGGSVDVTAPAGTSAIGTRIIQNGSGTGMVVRQTGPGTGFRSTVTVTGPATGY